MLFTAAAAAAAAAGRVVCLRLCLSSGPGRLRRTRARGRDSEVQRSACCAPLLGDTRAAVVEAPRESERDRESGIHEGR